jgi:hypothetical protein
MVRTEPTQFDFLKAVQFDRDVARPVMIPVGLKLN